MAGGVALGAGLALAAAAMAEPSVFPTGVTRYDPSQTYNSFVVFGAPDGKTHLIDMGGHEVHSWSKSGFPAYVIDPALTGGERGHVLVDTATTDLPGAGVVPKR